MRWYQGVVSAIVLVLVVPVGGLWLWGKPRAHVPFPTARASPAVVVQTYVRAMNDRDFDTCAHMELDSDGGFGAGWASLHAPNMQGLTINRVDPVVPGRRAAKDQYNSDLTAWEQTVEVDTTATLNNFQGVHASMPDQPWSFELVRHDSSQPWRIFDQGQG